MPWQPNPYSFPLFISALVALTLAIMVWRRRPAPGTGPLAMMLLTAALWAGGYGFLWGAPTLAGKLFWFIFSLLGVIGGTPAFFAFVLQYTGRHHWLSRPVLGGLTLEACVAFSLLLTNAAHGWWYTNPFISATGALQIEWGSGFWVHSTYVYSLVLIGYGLLVQAFFRAPPLYRAQTGTILLGASAPLAGSLVYNLLLGQHFFPDLDPTPFLFTLTGGVLAYGLLWFRLFDIVPIARHLLVEHMTDGVLVLDVLNRVVDVNPAALQLMRLPVSPVGRTLADLLPHWPASLVEYQHATSLQTEISVGENPVYYFDLRIVPLYSRDTHLRGRLIVFRDITQRRQIETAVQETNQRLQYQLTEIEALQSQLRDQAIRDPLTGLFNRRYLEETLGRELSRAEREATPLSIVMLDVDHFKRLNDEYGHKAGDLMLQALADLLRTHSRAGDVACRYGGEEFVMILPGAPIAVALRRAEEWRVAFEQLRLGFEGQILTRTISLGVAVYALHGATSEALMLEADAALYRAKAGGRNQVQVAGD